MPWGSNDDVVEISRVFYRRVGISWREVKTQWEEFARREVSVNPSRFSGMGRGDVIGWFEERLGSALRRSASLLRSVGLLATYYNHTSVEAWASLLRAG